MPAGVRPIPHWLIDAGYTTANVVTMAGERIGTGKTDLNFEVEGKTLVKGAASSAQHSPGPARHNLVNAERLFHTTDWAGLKQQQPFFAQINFSNVERTVHRDVVTDPYEVKNLAASKDPEHKRVLKELRSVLSRWIEETDDHGRHPESPAVFEFWDKEAMRLHRKFLK